MLITKEQLEKLLNKYINERHSTEECSGFIDGLNTMIEFIGGKSLPQTPK